MGFSNFIYPRTISISRPNPTTGVGSLPYQGLIPSDETLLFSGLPASIQHGGGTANKAGIPADTMSSPTWQIFIPTIPMGSIQDRDIVTDDLGERYQIQASYWNSLGYNCTCERLQT